MLTFARLVHATEMENTHCKRIFELKTENKFFCIFTENSFPSFHQQLHIKYVNQKRFLVTKTNGRKYLKPFGVFFCYVPGRNVYMFYKNISAISVLV